MPVLAYPDRELRDKMSQCLGRPLYDEDLVVRASLDDLSTQQIANVRAMRHNQIIVTAQYLRELVPGVGVDEMSSWLDKLI